MSSLASIRTKNKRDIWYQQAKIEGYRARSAFKLLQLDEEFQILADVTKAVDLCAAPGSWSQVLARQLNQNSKSRNDVKIVSVDLNEMAPIEGVICLQGDITSRKTADQIISYFSGLKSDIVVCDGAPDVTGNQPVDEYLQSQLINAALWITTKILKNGGTFVAKIFRGKDMSHLITSLKLYFDDVLITKPRSSRGSSLEAFILCRGFKDNQKIADVLTETSNPLVQFIQCGNLSGFDSDANNPDTKQIYESIMPPINMSYYEAFSLKKYNSI